MPELFDQRGARLHVLDVLIVQAVVGPLLLELRRVQGVLRRVPLLLLPGRRGALRRRGRDQRRLGRRDLVIHDPPGPLPLLWGAAAGLRLADELGRRREVGPDLVDAADELRLVGDARGEPLHGQRHLLDAGQRAGQVVEELAQLVGLERDPDVDVFVGGQEPFARDRVEVRHAVDVVLDGQLRGVVRHLWGGRSGAGPGRWEAWDGGELACAQRGGGGARMSREGGRGGGGVWETDIW